MKKKGILKKNKLIFSLIFFLFTSLLSQSVLRQIKLPKDFQIDYFAKNVPKARSMALSPSGILYVGTRASKLYAIFDSNKDYKADKVLILKNDLEMPNGVAFYKKALYVAEKTRILRFDNIEDSFKTPNGLTQDIPFKVIRDDFPTNRSHSWKFIGIGPDEKLYVPVGAPCNICKPNPKKYAAIFRLSLDGKKKEIFAKGIRNTVGFDWHPKTKNLWFTDNGRDWLGDQLPPDELNQATTKEMHFGYPYIHGKNIKDPKYGKKSDPFDYTPSAFDFKAHVAPLGMRFYQGDLFPKKYHHQIFVAQHGSWNRSKKIGYRLVVVFLENGKAIKKEIFAKGWLNEKTQKIIGRPVDVLIMPDGSLLISDDYKGCIYRVTYNKK